MTDDSNEVKLYNKIHTNHPEEFPIKKLENRVCWAIDLMKNSHDDREGKGYMKVIPHFSAYIVLRLKSISGPEFLLTNNDDCCLRDLSQKKESKYKSWFIDNGMETLY